MRGAPWIRSLSLAFRIGDRKHEKRTLPMRGAPWSRLLLLAVLYWRFAKTRQRELATN
jgi:hypothetical protein